MSFDPHCAGGVSPGWRPICRADWSPSGSTTPILAGLKLWQRLAMRNLLTSAIAWPHFIAYDIGRFRRSRRSSRVPVRVAASDLDRAHRRRARTRACAMPTP